MKAPGRHRLLTGWVIAVSPGHYPARAHRGRCSHIPASPGCALAWASHVQCDGARNACVRSTGAAGAPALRHLADHLQAAAPLVILIGMTQPRQCRGVVQYLADQAALQDQAEPDLALRIPDRVG